MKAETEEDRYHVSASSSLATEGRHVLKHDDTFAVLNRSGDVHPVDRGEQGLYHRGTKFLSRWQLRVNARPPLFLSSSARQNNLLVSVDLTNPDMYEDNGHLAVPYGTLHLARSKFLQDGQYLERVLLANYGSQAITLEISLEFAADFVDIFEVRGMNREQRGKLLPTEVATDHVLLRYRGLDEVTRTTRIEFAPAPDRLDERLATFEVHLESHQTRELYVWIGCEIEAHGSTQAERRPRVAYESALAEAGQRANARLESECIIETSNEQFNEWLTRSQADLHMLLTETRQGPFPYAGVPWFSTAFGRDGIWTALQTLWVQPEIAAGVLRFLSAHQATELDDSRDAEPGKIVHEMRDGEMAALREIPFGHYYGSIDSTPLYILLAARYYETTADRALIESIWPNLVAAHEWMQRYGDLDGDGFLEYGKRSKDGLLQQGWKDSSDCIFHRDGTAAAGPIALCEVQGYAYAALCGMATLSRVMGEPPERAAGYEHAAAQLRERFDRAFWCEELSTYALALDKNKLPCRVRTSNAGQCLYTGIALPERVAPLARQLMSEGLYSGWGIRTVSSDEARYNPMAYHNGSIWPHDNSIIAAGLAKCGYKQDAAVLLGAMFDVSLFMELHRLPELFCGFVRQPGQGPTLYPVACAPQAWASGSVFLLLRAALGLEIKAAERRIVFRDTFLPAFLDDVKITNLRVGSASLDVHLQRYPTDVGITVRQKKGTVEVVAVK